MRTHELAQWEAIIPLVTGAAKTGFDIYQARKGEKEEKKAREHEMRLMQMQAEAEAQKAAAEAARARALLLSQQAAGGFPWLTVGLIGGGVLIIGVVAFLLLRK